MPRTDIAFTYVTRVTAQIQLARCAWFAIKGL